MTDAKRLNDDELVQVSGGSAEFGGDHAMGTQKIGYCKYCDAEKLLTYIGNETGFVFGISVGRCNKWECSDCKCVNYYQKKQGILLK